MKISLGVPKGSLQEATLDLFRKAGIHVSLDPRSYYPATDDPELDLVLMRPQEMPRYVEIGVVDAGITGYDWVVENSARVVKVCELAYSKSTRQKARWVLAVPENSPFRTPEDLRGRRIATELVRTTTRFFKQKRIPVKVEFSWGATEAKPPRLADAIVDLTETGSSLRANRLRIIDTLLETTTVLIANRQAWRTNSKRHKIENLQMLLQGTLNAENYVGLKCNVRESDLPGVLAVMPALHKPTISHLSDKGWVAVETVLRISETKSVVPRLKRAGASGIVEFPICKIIP